MSRYKPLADFLSRRKGDEWEAGFPEIEAQLGFPLPPSAYRYPAWWANQSGPGHSQTHGWRSVGWRTSKLDLERERVRFEREKSSPRASAPLTAGASRGDSSDHGRLVEQAMQVSGISDADAVIAAALREFIAQEAIRGVIELGGSAPDFQPAPRERPWS